MISGIVFIIALIANIASIVLAFLSHDPQRILYTCSAVLVYVFGCGAAGAMLDKIGSRRGTGDTDVDSLCVFLWPISGVIFLGVIFGQLLARFANFVLRKS